MSDQLKVMISSTALDLPEHRKEVLDACLRVGIFPMMMEHLPASDAAGASVSLDMVDEADVYVGVVAYRYGYVPKENNPRQISVTEMEYDRAVERNIPCLIFMMDETHLITIKEVEFGDGAVKLHVFKEALKANNTVKFFKSPADLRAEVILSLSKLPEAERVREDKVAKFHYVSEIPNPPETYIAHPYTLLQTKRVIGRQEELNLLTDWVTNEQNPIYKARILNIVAIGGLGKSALTWNWFNDIAPQKMKLLKGRIWWSFYESDATFENFIIRALAYVSRQPLEEVQKIPAPERETQLLAALDREPFLIALDGLERILIAYARMDAARLEDNQVGNQKNLRKTADPRAGLFLRKLAQVRCSRVLISTRLYPAELETDGGEPIPGSFRYDLRGLTNEDAVKLWSAFNVTGSKDLLVETFNTFGKHPLLIQALAGEVKRSRRSSGNFETWRKFNPQFKPDKFPNLYQTMSHVLEFALSGVSKKARQALQIIAAFRMPAQYETLAALLIGEGKVCAEEQELDNILTELEDRGFVGWDKRANRYDLHPLVRGVVWSSLGDAARHGVYTSLHAHFEAVPMIDDFLKVNSLEDLTPAIELYNTLIGLGRYDDALVVFRDRLNKATLYRLNASRHRVELLELLFPDGLERLPCLNSQSDQAFTLNALALGYDLSGQPGRAAALYRRNIIIWLEMKDDGSVGSGLRNLSSTLLLSGALCASEFAARRALVITRERDNRFQEAISLNWLGLTLAARGRANESESALQRALRIDAAQSNNQAEGVDAYYLAHESLWRGEFVGALAFANRAWELAHFQNLERDFIHAARVQGEAALGLNDLAAADERLHHALTRARVVNLAEQELPALVALAELRRRQGDIEAAREFLDDVWEIAERGPFPLIHVDALNVLAQIERDEGNKEKAIEAAAKAYQLAWCDGPPFSYHWGLVAAKKHLQELGADEPEMPPFDESKFEPMPEVEIDPEDEFHAGNSDDESS